MFHLAIFGGNKIDGSTVDPGEQVFGLALFGGLEFDFTQCPAPEGAELMIFAIFGGATVKVREEENVMFSGVSLFGGRSMEPRRERYDRESDGDRIPLRRLARECRRPRVDVPLRPAPGGWSSEC